MANCLFGGFSRSHHYKILGITHYVSLISTEIGYSTLQLRSHPHFTSARCASKLCQPFNESLEEYVTEGKASILIPKGNRVFYNPVQQFNRDISILGIRAWSQIYENEENAKKSVQQFTMSKENYSGRDQISIESFSDGVSSEVASCQPQTSCTAAESTHDKPFIEIIEAFSATGLRSIRYALEISKVKEVIANDISASAIGSLKRNAIFSNAIPTVKPNEGDANMLMYQHKSKNVHVVDLDPYGSASPFMDAAVQAVRDGGLLLVTCTDLGVLAGNRYPEKCFSHYGGTTLHSDACHESALRLVLHMVASTAAKYGRSIEPMLSLSIDFYVRLFIRINSSPVKVKQNAANTMLIYHCNGCGSSVNQPLGKVQKKNNVDKFGYARGPIAPEKCTHCHTYHQIAGPMWGGPIHSDKFIQTMIDMSETLDPKIYQTIPRMKGMLTLAKDELKDAPFYFSVQNIASVVRTSSPPHRKVISALCNAGYDASSTHAQAGAIKTNAPYSVIWDILRQWITTENNGEVSKNLKPGSPGTVIVENLNTR